MKRILILCLLAIFLVACNQTEALKIYDADEEKIVKASQSEDGYIYRYVTAYKTDEAVVGAMEVVVYTDIDYKPIKVNLNPIGAGKLYQTMNYNEDGSVYGLVTSTGDPEVTYKITSEKALVEFYEGLETYTVVSKDQKKKNQVEIELKANTEFHVFTSYSFEVLEDHSGQLIIE